MKVYFEIEAGFLDRGGIRQQLQNSKAKLQHWYPGCRVLLTENSTAFASRFWFEADGIPDSAKRHMEQWLDKIRSLAR